MVNLFTSLFFGLLLGRWFLVLGDHVAEGYRGLCVLMVLLLGLGYPWLLVELVVKLCDFCFEQFLHRVEFLVFKVDFLFHRLHLLIHGLLLVLEVPDTVVIVFVFSLVGCLASATTHVILFTLSVNMNRKNSLLEFDFAMWTCQKGFITIH